MLEVILVLPNNGNLNSRYFSIVLYFSGMAGSVSTVQSITLRMELFALAEVLFLPPNKQFREELGTDG